MSKTDRSRHTTITTPGFLCDVGIQRLPASWPELDAVGDPCEAKSVDWDVVAGWELGSPEVGREAVSGSGEAEPGFGVVGSRGDTVSRLVEVDSGVVSGLGEEGSEVISGLVGVWSEVVSGLG